VTRDDPRLARRTFAGRVLSRLKRRHGIEDFSADERPDPFHTLIACVLSLRTKDEVTDRAAQRLLSRAGDARAMVLLSPEAIEKLIFPVGFYRRKARQVREISRLLIERHGGATPDAIEELLELPGVGRKTANLVVTVAFGQPGICVDTHVHRISNRFGWVRTKRPDETEQELRGFLPSRWWLIVNEILVRHGQRVCKPISPLCSACPVEAACPKIGVARRR